MTRRSVAWVPVIMQRLLAAPSRAGSTRVLAIDGPSGAGKSTLAAAVRDALPGPVPVVPLDRIYPGWDGLAASIPRLVEGVLEPLAEGRPAGYRRWDWMRNRDGRWIEVDPVSSGTITGGGGVLIVEGVGAGARACEPYLSLLVWVDAPVDVRFARAMARDGDTYRAHWQRWARQEQQYLAEHDPRARADIRVVDEAAALGPDAQDPGVA